MECLPPSLTTPRCRLRLWTVQDAGPLCAAIEANLDHLRPWMWWVAHEPMSHAARVDLVKGFNDDWARGGDAVFGIFVEDAIAGGCGLHRRRGDGVLEIGYWVHVAHIGRGLATEVAAELTNAALGVDGIDRVEIHHDRANTRSRAVPTKLGYQFIGETPDEARAPAEVGIDCCWATGRDDWMRGAPSSGSPPVRLR